MASNGVVLVPSLGERMKMALNYSGKTVNEMAEYLEVNPSSASRWISGKKDVKTMVLRLWAAQTGVNEQWLLTGEIPAGATVTDSCAWRDSNPQPSDLESTDIRKAIFRWLTSAGVPLGAEELAFLDAIDSTGSRRRPWSSLAGVASFRRVNRRLTANRGTTGVR